MGPLALPGSCDTPFPRRRLSLQFHLSLCSYPRLVVLLAPPCNLLRLLTSSSGERNAK